MCVLVSDVACNECNSTCLATTSSAESAETQDQMKGPSPPQTAPKQSDSTESTFNPVKSAFPLGKPPVPPAIPSCLALPCTQFGPEPCVLRESTFQP